ncbi:MAG TPA: AbrB family transcriptional regulator [Elusimicrobia bacterium]|nr:AbrB family transcriptional regulator [Elusimicrobiota bacterium]
MGSCQVESIITIDDRGQMVLPKELRLKAGIKPGDKMVLVSWNKDSKVHCISLIKSDELSLMVKGKLGPIMKEMSK